MHELYGLIGDKAGFFRGLFEMVKVAEETIAEKKIEHPDHADRVDRAFKYLKPSDIFHQFSSNKRLYKKHCEAIIERFLFAPKTLKYGTEAECLAALSIASLKAPPDSDHAYVYFTLFKKLFKDSYENVKYRTGSDPAGHESYPGRAKEILHWLKKKLITERNPDAKQNKQTSLFS